ncbi:thaicobrin-like [Rhineura floridana]|uniref:thaicobrin-like n=1 Tax=Rhineura floridana TaxID=261503 RepID=UPI002AC894B0|nr:thaicobrin-like [Rhineura floridana]
MERVQVTLDQHTAHRFLILSPNLKEVRCGDKHQNLPEDPERFDENFYVLGTQKFISGRHCWEVDVQVDGQWAEWAVGVAQESVRKKGEISLSPNEGIWAVGKLSGTPFSPTSYVAFTSPKWATLTLKHEPRKIQVLLDSEIRSVEFVDAVTNELIFTFPSASFSRREIRPFFWVSWGARMNC